MRNPAFHKISTFQKVWTLKQKRHLSNRISISIQAYLESIQEELDLKRATEHSYRGYLQNLFKDLVEEIKITNEPVRIDCGSPDYLISRNDIPIGHIEAKDIGVKLDDNSTQLMRYRGGLDNLLFTDYLTFKLYRYSKLVRILTIAELSSQAK